MTGRAHTFDLPLSEIARREGGRVVGDETVRVTGLNGVREAQPGDLAFVADDRYLPYLSQSRASAILTRQEADSGGVPLVIVDDPYGAFLRLAAEMRPKRRNLGGGVSSMAAVDEDASLGADVTIDALARVCAGARVGDGCVIHAGAYVGPDAELGPSCVVHPNASILENVRLGARCVIHAGAVIGADGFGYQQTAGGIEKIPQLGTVVLGDDVEVGANSCIDRATFAETVVGGGTKIDNLVQIGHNVRIGNNAILCGMVGVSGSTVIGNGVTMAANSGASGHLEIGDGATVAARGGVVKSIPPGETVSGFPARPHSEELRRMAGLRKVPGALRRLQQLEARVTELEGLLHGREAEDDS